MKDNFYHSLLTIFQDRPKNILFIMGDFTVKIGSVNRGYEIMGQFGTRRATATWLPSLECDTSAGRNLQFREHIYLEMSIIIGNVSIVEF
nr:hypothetical protein; partial [Biomphalaria glabrata]